MKKLLALVLAMVMTLGLATVGASAAAPKYADSDSINYKQAVDVMSTIGVLGGDENGFRPGDELKRSEGAKIIAYLMLGSTAAEQITGGTKYTDVPASHWAAGYIEYLTVEGVVGGIGDKKFDPDGTLTTAAFTKMLIGALGYDAEIEGLGGPDWAINVQRLAKQIGLFDGNKNAVASANIKREEAAQYAFNMIKSPLVEYENKGSTMTVNGATINFGAGKAKYRVNTGKSWARYDQIDTKLTNDNNASQIVEFAEEYYEKLVLKGNGDTDAFDRPADIWTYNGKKIGEYPKSEDLLYTSTVTLGTIYKDLGLTKATYPTDDKTATGTSLYFRDGVQQTGVDLTAVKIDKESSVPIGGNGTETYVYYDEGKVRICEVNWYVGDVTGVFAATSSKDPYIDIAGRGDDATYNKSGSKSNVDFKVDDIVIFTASLDGNKVDIQSVQKAETTKGKLDSFVMRGKEGLSQASVGSVTLGGKKYTYSAKIANAPEGNFIKSNIELDVVLDKYGYAIDVGDYGVQNYAVVTNVSTQGGSWRTDKIVNLLFTDGTTTGAVTLSDKHTTVGGTNGFGLGRILANAAANELLSADVDYYNSVDDNDYYDYRVVAPATAANGWTTDKSGGITVGDIVTYTIDSDGKYTLTLKKHANIYTNGTGADEEILSNGKSSLPQTAFNYGNGTYTKPKDYQGNGKTAYLIKDDKGNFKAYEGSKDIPTVKLDNGFGPIFVNSYAAYKNRNGDQTNSSAAQVVYVDMRDQATIFTNEAIFVRIDSKYSKSVDGNNERYYAVEAIVNGKHYVDNDLFKVDVTSYRDAQDEAIRTGMNIVLFTSMTTNSRGIASLSGMKSILDGVRDGMPRLGSKPVKNGMVGLGATMNDSTDITFEAYTKDVSVWYLNDQGEIVKSSIANIPDCESPVKNVYSWFTYDSSLNVNYVLWTDNLAGVTGNWKDFDVSTKEVTFAELQAALSDNDYDEVNIYNVKVNGFTLPVSSTGATLTVPAGKKLNVYYNNDKLTYGDLIVPYTGTSAALLVNGEINCAKFQVEGRVNVETTGVINMTGVDIETTGHIKTQGKIHTTDPGFGNVIRGSSLEIRDGEARFAGNVDVLGGLSMTKGTVVFEKTVSISKEANVSLGGGSFRAAALTLAKAATMKISGKITVSITTVKMGAETDIQLNSSTVKLVITETVSTAGKNDTPGTITANADAKVSIAAPDPAIELVGTKSVTAAVITLSAPGSDKLPMYEEEIEEYFEKEVVRSSGAKVAVTAKYTEVNENSKKESKSSTYTYANKDDTVLIKITITGQEAKMQDLKDKEGNVIGKEIVKDEDGNIVYVDVAIDKDNITINPDDSFTVKSALASKSDTTWEVSYIYTFE